MRSSRSKAAPTRPPMARHQIKAPDSIGAAVDGLFKLRADRKRLEADAAKLKERETALEEDIFARFKKSELEGARGRLAQASVWAADVPTLEDDDKFFKYLAKHPEDLDLLQRRLSLEACRARWADKHAIPGVGIFTRIKLHLTKVPAGRGAAAFKVPADGAPLAALRKKR